MFKNFMKDLFTGFNAAIDNTMLGMVAMGITLILTVIIYIYWTRSERFYYITREGRMQHRYLKVIISLLLGGFVSFTICFIFYALFKATVIVVKWSAIYAVIALCMITVLGLFTKDTLEE